MSKPFFRNSVLGVCIASLVLLADAAQGAKAADRGREPIVVTSRRMEADKLGDKVMFIGDVTLKKEDITLSSDSVIVFYDAASKGVREIEALGNVVVRKEGRVGLAKRALYYSREEKIVLSGDARIIENENELGGDRITLYIRDDRSVIEGGKAVLYQEKPVEKKRPEQKKGAERGRR